MGRKDNTMIIDAKQFSGPCACGREHTMATEFSLVEPGCLAKVGQYMKEYGLTGYTVAVYDENTYRATQGLHPRADLEVILDPKDLHANEHGVQLLARQLPSQTQVLIAVGGGTIHDITRYNAWERGIDFVSCPTAASVDGFCSSVAAMTWKGCKKTLTCVAPKIVLADIDVIRNAPLYLAKSGFGDMIGKFVALTEWKMAHELTGEFYCQRIAQLTMDATQAVLNSAEGILHRDAESYEKLVGGLLLSGIAMQMMGSSRPASGAEHHISHLIEMEPEGLGVHSDALHGEKVGVGTLLVAREYHRLAQLETVDFSDYRPFSESFLEPVFGGRLFEEILAENKNDCALGITAGQLREHWPQMRRCIRDIPHPDDLTRLYGKLGIKASLESIGVSNEKEQQLLRYCPCIRNRLTLLRLRRCFQGVDGGQTA